MTRVLAASTRWGCWAAGPAADIHRDVYHLIMNQLIEIVGWSGAALVLLAYGLLSAHKLSSRAVSYHVLNIAGSIGLALNTYWNGALPSAAVNLIWMSIGAHALWRNSRTSQEG